MLFYFTECWDIWDETEDSETLVALASIAATNGDDTSQTQLFPAVLLQATLVREKMIRTKTNGRHIMKASLTNWLTDLQKSWAAMRTVGVVDDVRPRSSQPSSSENAGFVSHLSFYTLV